MFDTLDIVIVNTPTFFPSCLISAKKKAFIPSSRYNLSSTANKHQIKLTFITSRTLYRDQLLNRYVTLSLCTPSFPGIFIYMWRKRVIETLGSYCVSEAWRFLLWSNCLAPMLFFSRKLDYVKEGLKTVSYWMPHERTFGHSAPVLWFCSKRGSELRSCACAVTKIHAGNQHRDRKKDRNKKTTKIDKLING